MISHDNGQGLTHDAKLLAEFLASRGHETRFVEWESRSELADVNVYLELFHARHLETAPRHIGVFNFEWFAREWLPYLPQFTQLWAKSREAHEWLLSKGLPAYYTGYLSRDLLDPTVPRERRVLHVRGASMYKGTDTVLAAWQEFGAVLPPLTLITSEAFPYVPGVTQRVGRLTDAELKSEMNRHRIHLCPSVCEGWGHYIAEANACHAFVITTDASPMNEHVPPGNGLRLTPIRRARVPGTGAWKSGVDPEAVAVAVREAAAFSDDKLAREGLHARLYWWRRQQHFARVVDDLLGRL